MNGRCLIPTILCTIAIAGSQSPNWRGQTAGVREAAAEPRVIPPGTPAPVGHVRSPSLAITNSPFGPYDSALVKAIQDKWEALLKDVQFGKDVGKVVVRFNLHPDGTISDLAALINTLL